MPLFFLFDLFLEPSAEILKKNVGTLVETMTPKGHFEINWPLVEVEKNLLFSDWLWPYCGVLNRLYLVMASPLGLWGSSEPRLELLLSSKRIIGGLGMLLKDSGDTMFSSSALIWQDFRSKPYFSIIFNL